MLTLHINHIHLISFDEMDPIMHLDQGFRNIAILSKCTIYLGRLGGVYYRILDNQAGILQKVETN